MYKSNCLYCGKEIEGQRRTLKYCSTRCAQRYLHGSAKERTCKVCGKVFKIEKYGDNNRRYCSQKCSKKSYAKQAGTWRIEHSDELKLYMHERNKREVESGKVKTRRQGDRLESIRLLGGKCIVCGATNPNWLHIDFIPTTRNLPFRHPRHLRYIREHLSEFRLLCANHHYELTLTGRIEGTDITQ
jgi:predicted nucleic acid-binding Zn ribbon protein